MERRTTHDRSPAIVVAGGRRRLILIAGWPPDELTRCEDAPVTLEHVHLLQE
jgi:hypothetical protein